MPPPMGGRVRNPSMTAFWPLRSSTVSPAQLRAWPMGAAMTSLVRDVAPLSGPPSPEYTTRPGGHSPVARTTTAKPVTEATPAPSTARRREGSLISPPPTGGEPDEDAVGFRWIIVVAADGVVRLVVAEVPRGAHVLGVPAAGLELGAED